MHLQDMDQSVIAELARTGTLRAGINMSNFLLVAGMSGTGDPDGVAPDLARAIAERLGVTLTFKPFTKASEVAEAVATGACDIGLIGVEPDRAETIAFTPPYALIEATYLVPAGSSLETVADVDQPGNRIAVSANSAYDLWLTRNTKHASLLRAASIPAARELFLTQRLDALAGLRPGLLSDAAELAGVRVLDEYFSVVQQAVGTACANLESAAFLQSFVEEAKGSGLVARLIARHRAEGLSVPPASQPARAAGRAR